jgi:hypothetical protein
MVFANPILEKQTVMKPWTKPVSGWKLECESKGETRLKAFEKFYNMSFDSANIKNSDDKYNRYDTAITIIFLSVVFLCLSIGFGICSMIAQLILIGVQRLTVVICATVLLVRMNKNQE